MTHEFSHFCLSGALPHAAAGQWASARVGLSCLPCLPRLTYNNLFHFFCCPSQPWLHFTEFEIPKHHWFTSYGLRYTERKYNSLTTLGQRYFLDQRFPAWATRAGLTGVICCRDSSSPGSLLPRCSSWSSAPTTPTTAPAVPHSALRYFATPGTSAGILHPFGLGEQLSITTLTSARQELQRLRATVLRYLPPLYPSVPTHRVTMLLFVRGQSALITRWRCYQQYFCVHILFWSLFLLGSALPVTSPWPYHLLCVSASGYFECMLRCFPVIALPWSAACAPSRQNTSGRRLKLLSKCINLEVQYIHLRDRGIKKTSQPKKCIR